LWGKSALRRLNLKCDVAGGSYGRMIISGRQLRWYFVESATRQVVDEFVLDK
jgi:hypothetical protein